MAGKLKHIARCLMDSFTSRNNDLDGYWAMGVLRREAGCEKLTINLLNMAVNPKTAGSKGIAAHWSNELERYIKLNKISHPGTIDTATLTLWFLENDICTVLFEIKTKNGTNSSLKYQVPCWPHTASRESRRCKGQWGIRSRKFWWV